jgi:hypothetical protein
MPRAQFLAELQEGKIDTKNNKPVETNFAYSYDEMCDASALRSKVAEHPIKSVFKYKIVDIIKAGHKLAYGEAYQSVCPDGTGHVKLAENRKQICLTVGEKGSIARYRAIVEYFDIYMPASNINEYKFYKIFCETLLDSLVEPELIDRVLHAQKEMVNRLKFVGSGKYGVNTQVLADIQFVVDKLKQEVADADMEWRHYCCHIKDRYEYIERWKNFSDIGRQKEKQRNGYLYNKYIVGDGIFRYEETGCWSGGYEPD